MQSLVGQVALVTGASSGIGRAVARLLAEHGARVVVTARREERLKAVCGEIVAAGGEAIWFAGDAAEESTAVGAVALALERFGRLDIVINNAGAGSYKDLVETSVAEYDELMAVNMRSSFLFARYAAPVLMAQGGGTLLFISSVAGLQGAAGEAVYCAAKFAQVGFAQAVDGELRKYGVKVGVICPGGVKTEFAVGKGRTEEGVRASKMMEPEEVAESIVFACMQPKGARILQMTVRHMG